MNDCKNCKHYEDKLYTPICAFNEYVYYYDYCKAYKQRCENIEKCDMKEVKEDE